MSFDLGSTGGYNIDVTILVGVGGREGGEGAGTICYLLQRRLTLESSKSKKHVSLQLGMHAI